PLEVAISVGTYFGARFGYFRTIERAWKWSPISWNELVWLPLPCATSLMILLVKEDREEGFKKIVFVALERPCQHGVAKAGLEALALDDLSANSISSLSTVPKRLNWIIDLKERLDWTTSKPVGELPDMLATLLPRIERVGQQADQYLALNSAFLKRKALER